MEWVHAMLGVWDYEFIGMRLRGIGHPGHCTAFRKMTRHICMSRIPLVIKPPTWMCA